MSYLKNHKLLLLIIGVLLLANISLLWFYVWKKPQTPSGPPRVAARERLIKEVGFTNLQVATYDSIRKIHYDGIGPMFENLRHSKDSLFKLMHQPMVDDSLIGLQSADVFEKQKAIDLKMHRYFRSIRDLCTDDQKPKMDSFLVNLAKRMSGGNRRGPGGPGGDKKEKK
jgi:Spy/CpxP family protein refolding chaperone